MIRKRPSTAKTRSFFRLYFCIYTCVNKHQKLIMSCIKFPSTSNDLEKSSSKEKASSYLSVKSQLIDTANNVFGEGNWSHSITNQTIDFTDYIAGKYHAGCATIVKVQLSNGTYHEDVGYSNLEGSSKASVLQKVRLDSLNMALKQVFLYFGNEFSIKLKNVTNCTVNSVPKEEVSSQVIISKEEVLPKTVITKEQSVSPVALSVNEKNTEVFDGAISMTQTSDALMDTVDLDELLDKVSKSNDTNNLNKDFTTTSVFKPSACLGSLMEKDKNHNIIKTQIPVLSTHSQNGKKLTSSSKKEIQDVPKHTVHTAMTESEMRLERKRKQREMQEEFKRKQESKKVHMDSGSKPAPNPRY